MHARLENGAVVEYPIHDLRLRLPEVSLPVDMTNDATLPEGFVYAHPVPVPSYNPLTQRVVESSPALLDGRWMRQYAVIDLSAQELEQAQQANSEIVKTQRRQAYQTESDPLFFKWQRAEATKEDWLAKVQEIKTRFPL